MHPNGQLPAYEFAFGDVNPPVHAWACLARLQDRRATEAQRDHVFLESAFPETADEFHMVGQPQRRRRARTFSPADFLGWTTSAFSTAPSRCPTGGTPRTSGRHRLDGLLLRHDALDGAGTGAAQPGLRRHRVEIFRAFRGHHRRHELTRRNRDCGTKKTGFITTSFTWMERPCRCPFGRWSA